MLSSVFTCCYINGPVSSNRLRKAFSVKKNFIYICVATLWCKSVYCLTGSKDSCHTACLAQRWDSQASVSAQWEEVDESLLVISQEYSRIASIFCELNTVTLNSSSSFCSITTLIINRLIREALT